MRKNGDDIEVSREELTKTLMYPNIDSVVLSRMPLILYSKFWAATESHRDRFFFFDKLVGLTEWIQEVGPILALESCDLPAGTTHARIYIEGFPEAVQTIVTWSRANVQKDTYIRLEWSSLPWSICQEEYLNTIPVARDQKR